MIKHSINNVNGHLLASNNTVSNCIQQKLLEIHGENEHIYKSMGAKASLGDFLFCFISVN